MNKRYKSHKGLAEKQLKIRLNKNGWEIWRAGFIHIIRTKDLYPNVFQKYIRLRKLSNFEYLQYLSAVHHGMPDFLCRRKKIIKFVECKFANEQLSTRQKKCIIKLQSMGYKVEIHKLVFSSTKFRLAYLNLETGQLNVIEKQARLKLRY